MHLHLPLSSIFNSIYVDEYTSGDAQVEQLMQWMLRDLGLDKYIAKNVYQNGKEGITNSGGNWSTKKMARRRDRSRCLEGFDMVEQSTDTTKIIEGTPLNEEQDAR